MTTRVRWLLVLAGVLFVATAAADSSPQRIASLNLCTDQLLLLLLPRERIVSVTEWAQRPDISYMAAAAQGLPVNFGLAERVLPHQPDLILAGEFNDHAMVAMMRQLGYRVEILRVPRNLAEAERFILEFGDLIGARPAAQALVTNMQQRLARIAEQVGNRPAGLAAVYSPNGTSAGRGTVMEEILTRAGWRNLGSELGLNGYGQLPLEQLIRGQPDLLVFDTTAEPTGGASLAHAYLDHPALKALPGRARRLVLPPPLSVCVGPMTVEAIETLVAAR